MSFARTAQYCPTLNPCAGLKFSGGMTLGGLQGDFSVFGRQAGVRCLSIVSGIVKAPE